ncbi:S41 family peptidase [Shewanella woodyi]|uniref:S41 family peptidase n=1 Tax=Shewanella woodyi TaxID=60961 RepID=UPI003747ACDD
MNFSFKDVVNVFGICLLLSILQLSHFLVIDNTTKMSLSPRQMQQDLDTLVAEVSQHSAVSALEPQLLQRIESRINSLRYLYSLGIDSSRFHAEIAKLLAQLNDPGINLSSSDYSTGQLPFSLKPMGQLWLALDDSETPLDLEHPFVSHIDGVALSYWLKTARKFISSSQQEDLALTLTWLSRLDLLRAEMGLPLGDTVSLTLTNDEESKKELTLTIHSQAKLPYKDLVIGSQDKDTNPIKIADLDKLSTNRKLLSQLETAFENPLTVLDLRQAEGYSDKLLSLLTNEFSPSLPESASPVFTLARYRRASNFKSDYLRADYLHPFNELDFFEQVQLSEIKMKIETQNSDNFSQLYARKNHPQTRKAQRSNRLALIIGSQCRQECEWIVYLAKAWPRVTLIGEKTLGDLGKHYHFTLPNSKLNIALTSSLHYNLQGALISGVGTEPDITFTDSEPLHWQSLVTELNNQASPENSQQAPKGFVTAISN